LPAKHKWKEQTNEGWAFIITGLAMFLVSAPLSNYIDVNNEILERFLVLIHGIFTAFFLGVFLYGIISRSITHELEITNDRVLYTKKTLFKNTSASKKLSSFTGIYILESQRFNKNYAGDMEIPETIYTVLLVHPKLINIKIPLYEATVKSIALTKAQRYAELLKVPVLDENFEGIVFEV